VSVLCRFVIHPAIHSYIIIIISSSSRHREHGPALRIYAYINSNTTTLRQKIKTYIHQNTSANIKLVENSEIKPIIKMVSITVLASSE